MLIVDSDAVAVGLALVIGVVVNRLATPVGNPVLPRRVGGRGGR